MVEFDPYNCSVKKAFSCHGEEKFLEVIFVIIMFIVILFGVCGNALVMISTLTFPTLTKRVTNLFIFSLAFADFLVCITLMPFFTSKIVYCNCWYFGLIYCRMYIANEYLFSTASIFHLLCISVDRYIAVFYPLKYSKTMTRKRVIIIIFVVWIYSLLLSNIPIYTNIYIADFSEKLFQENAYYCNVAVNRIFGIFTSVLCFFLPGIFMSVIYYRIFRVAYVRENNITKILENCIRRQTLRMDSTDDRSLYLSEEIYHDRKTTKMLCIVMGVFLACWSGFVTIYILSSVFHVSNIPTAIVNLCVVLACLNSCMNPFIYTFHHKSFRKSFRNLLFCHPIKETHSQNMRRVISNIYRPTSAYKYYPKTKLSLTPSFMN